MSKILTFKNIITIILILVPLLISSILLRDNQNIKNTAEVIIEVSQIRSALSSYLSEKGKYPEGAEVVLGSKKSKVLCLSSNYESGFMEKDLCKGDIILNLQDIGMDKVFIYSSKGLSYYIDFYIPRKIGAFKQKGNYCARENGIFFGKCKI